MRLEFTVIMVSLACSWACTGTGGTTTSTTLSSSSGGSSSGAPWTCMDGVGTALELPGGEPRPGPWMPGADGTLWVPVLAAGSLHLLERDPVTGAWSRGDVPAPPGSTGAGEPVHGVVDADGRIHLVFASSAGTAAWHAVRDGNTWTHEELGSGPALTGLRVTRAGEDVLAAWSAQGVHAVLLPRSGARGNVEVVSSAEDAALRDVAVDGSGTVHALTTRGGNTDGNAQVHVRAQDGTWSGGDVDITAVAARALVPERTGVSLLHQRSGVPAPSDVLVSTLSGARTVIATASIELAVATHADQATVDVNAAGRPRVLYERRDSTRTDAQLMEAVRDASGAWELVALALSVEPGAGPSRPLLHAGDVVHRLTAEGPQLKHRVVCR